MTALAPLNVTDITASRANVTDVTDPPVTNPGYIGYKVINAAKYIEIIEYFCRKFITENVTDVTWAISLWICSYKERFITDIIGLELALGSLLSFPPFRRRGAPLLEGGGHG